MQPWAFTDDESLPTIAYRWKSIINVTGPLSTRYDLYTNELDYVTHKQVYERVFVCFIFKNKYCTY